MISLNKIIQLIVVLEFKSFFKFMNWLRGISLKKKFEKYFEPLLKASESNKTLTIIGVGPGDPSLLTLAAVEAIQNASLVSYPIPKNDEDSRAAQIASFLIKKDQKRLPLYFPMVEDSFSLKKAWIDISQKLANQIKNGEKVVYLSMGDVSFFSTGSYLLLSFENNYPQYSVKIIPGVSSFSAAAAISKFSLALQKDQVLILPTPDNSNELRSLLCEASKLNRVIVLLKIGSRWEWVQPILEEMDLLENSIFAQNVGFSDQKVMPAINIPVSSKPYFSLLLIRQSWPKVLP